MKFEEKLNHFLFAVAVGNDCIKMACRVFGRNQAWRYTSEKHLVNASRKRS